jgi:hypothetical protein
VAEKQINLLLQLSLSRHPELPDVPLVMDLARDDASRQMFALAFPTRVRLLYHKAPAGFPLRHVVDRDLELAVSMFAPGAETVKERTIHTAIGVAHCCPVHMPVAVASPRTALLVHGQVDFRKGLCDGVAHGDKILPGDSLLAPGQAKEGIEHLVRMSEQVNQVLTVWAVSAR